MGRQPFIAITLYEFSSDAEGYQPLYREDVSLIYAESEEEARAVTAARFRSEAGTYKNEAGNNITVSPKEIVDVASALVDDLSEDCDLYARHFRDFAAYSKMEPLLGD
ncbi:DUF4288 domain-containing protein [Nocardia carnea]|uniref:DUF4288 domain-containing protein n=1 Tax=Nocardia carnea TaxID=37328 RepID=UPI0024549188|nr:DUF4288 domain-containing protein [Nocardia carnea]